MKLLYALERIVAYLLYFTGVYWLVKRRLEREGAAVVLVYHHVLPGLRGMGEMVGEEAFDCQMRFLSECCRPSDWRGLREPGDTKGIKVLVTFDDGYRDNFTRALPIMGHYGIRGVLFVVTEFVFGRRRIDADDGETADEVFPTDDDLEAARKSSCITFGNHTASHKFVSGLDAGEFENELASSQALFQERLGEKPSLFAYPRGRRGDYTEAAAPVLEKCGFEAAFTMEPGRVTAQTPAYFVPRIGMSHVNDEIVFKVKMLGLLAPLVKLKNALGR
jgi:peptidoglycan/xylan/chitin deacetylase (PgdA/CDA1 family)